MPDKLRKRGTKYKHQHVEPTLEEQVRTWYNSHRRSAWWWGDERGGWPNIWMTMAKKFEIPIAQVKNIVGHQGITDRPIPAPLTAAEHRVRQENKGDQMAEGVRRQQARDFQRALWDAEHGR